MPYHGNGLLAQFDANISLGGRRKRSVRVSVFRTFRAMSNYCRQRYETSTRHLRAVFFPSQNGKRIGEIVFCIKDLPHELVVHECTHAAVAWWRTIHGASITDNETLIHNEEAFVSALGSMANYVEARVAELRPKSDVELDTQD